MRRSRTVTPAAGFTLIEVVVVLVIAGLGLGLAAPRFLAPPPAPDQPLQRVIDVARRAAVHRALTTVLSLESDGRWIILAEDAPASAPLAQGTLDPPLAPAARLHVSPLGSCMLLSPAGSLPYRLDPVRCRLSAR